MDLLVLDNRDARTTLRNAERFVQARVDLVIGFQIDQQVAPIVADKVARASIPLITVEIPCPDATYFGVDNYRVGFVAGEFLGQHARKAWKGDANWILGLDIEEERAFGRNRITGAFEGIRQVLPDIPVERLRVDARGLSDKSYKLTAEFLRSQFLLTQHALHEPALSFHLGRSEWPSRRGRGWSWSLSAGAPLHQ